jgi:hypothetical protein
MHANIYAEMKAMAKEIQKILCTIDISAGAIDIEHVQLMSSVPFRTIPARPYMLFIYGIRYIHTPYIVKVYGWQ